MDVCWADVTVGDATDLISGFRSGGPRGKVFSLLQISGGPSHAEYGPIEYRSNTNKL